MNFALQNALRALPQAKRKTTILILSVVFFFASSLSAVPEILAQKRFSKTYPASKNVRLQLMNRTGTVVVQGWNKDLVEIKADLEAPAATIIPQNQSGKILINVVKDNQARGEVGSCNFTIRVPFDSAVDIETKVGNLRISDVRGVLVRAHISTEGEITLTNIFASMVTAENGIGNIFFDGEVQQGGTYRFTSTRGEINLRIPFTSSFKLVATAPSTRSIDLGSFSGGGDWSTVGDGRRVIGKVNGGSANLTVTNLRGRISFIRR
jgi:hypothetical protein